MTAENINSLIIGISGSIIATVLLWICKPLLKKFGTYIVERKSKRDIKYRNELYQNASSLDKTTNSILLNKLLISSNFLLITFFLVLEFVVILFTLNKIICLLLEQLKRDIPNYLKINNPTIFIVIFIIIFLLVGYGYINSIILISRVEKINNLIRNFECKIRILKLTFEERTELEYHWANIKTKEDYDLLMDQLKLIASLKEKLSENEINKLIQRIKERK